MSARKRAPWTQQRIAQLRALMDDGCSWAQAGAAMRISRYAANSAGTRFRISSRRPTGRPLKKHISRGIQEVMYTGKCRPGVLERHKQVIMLRDEGMTYKQIAECIKTTVAVVAQRLWRARYLYADLIFEDDDDEENTAPRELAPWPEHARFD